MFDLICAEFAVTSDNLKLPQFWKLPDLEAIHLVKQMGNCRVNIDPRPVGLQPNELVNMQTPKALAGMGKCW